MSSKIEQYDLKLGNIVIRNLGQRTVSVIGGKGSGKTQTLKMLALASPLPVLIIDPLGQMDIPGKESFKIKIEKTDKDKGEKAANILTKYKAKIVILSFQNLLNEEMVEFLDTFLPAFVVKDYVLIIDEVQNLASQNPRGTGYSMELQRFIKHCRNRNVGVIMASQRIASVNKEIIALSDAVILYRVVWNNDLEVIKELLRNALTEEKVKEILTTIQTKGFLQGFYIDFIPSFSS